MRVSLSVLASVVVALFAGAIQAATVSTTVDTDTGMVRLDFTNLPPYEQIRLEGLTALYWCNCADPDNPSSLASTSFTVNGSNLEMKYEGAPPPSRNYITYYYFDDYVLSGFESVDWIVVTPLGGDDVRLTGERPILVPEPPGSLLRFVGLMALFVLRTLSRNTGATEGPSPSSM
jgi:hypothetical protein